MKKIFTIISLTLVFAGVTTANKVPVASYSELSTAITNATDGDTIVLTNGYEAYFGAGVDLNVSKKIMIVAADTITKTPEISKFGFKLLNNSSFTIDGVKAYYDAPDATTFTDSKYFIQAVTESAIDSIKIVNCEILNYGRAMVRADNANIATITKLIIDNCLVTNTSAVNAGYSTLALKTAKISQATIKNSTFAGNISGFYYSEQGGYPINFLMQNVTIYNCGILGAKNLINFNANTGSSYVIENCALAGSYNTTFDKAAISIGATDGAVKLLNSIVMVTTTASSPIAATWTEDTRILDVTKFTLDASYKITASKLLNNIGDPRGYPMTVDNATGIENKVNVKSYVIANNNIVLTVASDIQIYTIGGKSIFAAKATKNISIAHLPKGLYIMKITGNDDIISTMKFIR